MRQGLQAAAPQAGLAVGLLVALLGACGGGVEVRDLGGPRGRGPSAVHVLAGEQLEWEVRWLDVVVGRVQLGVGQPGQLDGRTVVVTRSRAASDGALALFLHPGGLELTNWIDVERGVPIAQAGRFDRVYDGEVFGMRLGAFAWPMTPWKTQPGPPIHSIHSALGLLRGWRAQGGERTTILVRLRSRVVRLDLAAVGRETMRSALGRRSALKIAGTLTPLARDLTPRPGARSSALALWIDDGGERAPLAMELEVGVGVMRLTLALYE